MSVKGGGEETEGEGCVEKGEIIEGRGGGGEEGLLMGVWIVSIFSTHV